MCPRSQNISLLNSKIKQDTLCKDYENGCLKNVDITFKIIILQCSWVKQLSGSSTNAYLYI